MGRVVTDRVLQGPFVTRAAAARRAGIPATEIVHRPDLLQVGGTTYKEAYFAFQFDRNGIRHDVGRLVLAFRGRLDDTTIADRLVRANAELNNVSPLSWLNRGGDVAQAIDSIRKFGSSATGSGVAPSRPGADSTSIEPPPATVRPETPRGMRFRPAGSH
jgi:hypothetical protein